MPKTRGVFAPLGYIETAGSAICINPLHPDNIANAPWLTQFRFLGDRANQSHLLPFPGSQVTPSGSHVEGIVRGPKETYGEQEEDRRPTPSGDSGRNCAYADSYERKTGMRPQPVS